MARSVNTLELWLRAQIANEPWEFDDSCIPMAWKISEAERPRRTLVFGVIWDDGVIRPSPPVTVSAP
jgi:amidase